MARDAEGVQGMDRRSVEVKIRGDWGKEWTLWDLSKVLHEFADRETGNEPRVETLHLEPGPVETGRDGRSWSRYLVLRWSYGSKDP